MKKTKKLIFFTVNDFVKDGGSTIRIYGILNGLASHGYDITLISNINDVSNFHSKIKHINIKYKLTKKDKRIIQFITALFPKIVIQYLYKIFFTRMKKILDQYKEYDIIFFDYLDNTLAYNFKIQKLISNYINDTHSIATLEFINKETDSFLLKLNSVLKHYIADLLDKKVFYHAKSIIYVSETMNEYFNEKYSFLSKKKSYILSDGVTEQLCSQKIDKEFVLKLKKSYNIENDKKVILFAGRFKELGGVVNLIEAFFIAYQKNKNLILFLIGDGEEEIKSKNLVKKYNLERVVIFAGVVEYSKLRSYQELANVIVCPDKQHPYSEIVPHIKYFDSLISNKIVINGSFKSVKEINIAEKYSLDFIPSDNQDLADKILYAINNENILMDRYKNNQKEICLNFSYKTMVKKLLNDKI